MEEASPSLRPGTAVLRKRTKARIEEVEQFSLLHTCNNIYSARHVEHIHLGKGFESKDQGQGQIFKVQMYRLGCSMDEINESIPINECAFYADLVIKTNLHLLQGLLDGALNCSATANGG